MIICYHKRRRKFYVLKSNKKEDRKFMFYSPSYDECADWILARGHHPVASRSALAALGCDPTRPTPSSDAFVGDPAMVGAMGGMHVGSSHDDGEE